MLNAGSARNEPVGVTCQVWGPWQSRACTRAAEPIPVGAWFLWAGLPFQRISLEVQAEAGPWRPIVWRPRRYTGRVDKGLGAQGEAGIL